MPTLILSPATRYAIMLLPIAFIAHLAEEWFGGFTGWTAVALSRAVSAERYLLINAVALPAFTVCAFVSLRSTANAWLAASLATLLGLNGVLHALATVAFNRYSPGVGTGLVLYVPLAAFVLRSLSSQLPASSLARAVIIGIAAHAVVAVAAFM